MDKLYNPVNKTFKAITAGDTIYRINTSTQKLIPYIVKSVDKANFLTYGMGMLLLAYYRLSPPDAERLEVEDLLKKAHEVNIDVPLVWLVVPESSKVIMTQTKPPYVLGTTPEAIEVYMHKG